MALRNNMVLVNDGTRTTPLTKEEIAKRREGGKAIANAMYLNGGTGTSVEDRARYARDAYKVYGNSTENATQLQRAVDALGNYSSTPYSYKDASERNSYLAALKAQLDAQNAAYDQLLAYNQQMYEAQRKQAAQQREDNARRAYIAKEMALKNLPGQLAREGINGGLAESSYVRLNNRYNSSLADADNAYSDAVNQAYLDMIQANREPQAGKMNAQASYSAGVAKAPGVKTITGKKVTDTGDIRAFAEAMAKLGYTSEQAADIWNRRYG